MLTIPKTDALTQAEARVLALVEAGHPNQMIAASPGGTVGTVKGRLVHIYRKSSVRNRTGALAKAMQMGLLR